MEEELKETEDEIASKKRKLEEKAVESKAKVASIWEQMKQESQVPPTKVIDLVCNC